MESKPSVDTVDLDISIKQEPDLNTDESESAESDGQTQPKKRTIEACARTKEFFRKLFANRLGQSKVECRKCGNRVVLQSLRGKRRTPYFSSDNVRQHAAKHIDKPMYSCLHCGETCTNSHRITNHMQRVHKTCSKDYYSDFSDSYEKEIFAMAEECFGENSNKDYEDDDLINTQNVIKQYFVRLYRSNWKDATRIVCNLCGVGLTVRETRGEGKRFRLSKAISHAAIHLEKSMFSCRQCSHQSVSRTAMFAHLRTRHALGGGHPGNYVDRMHEFKNELIDLFGRCYGRTEGERMVTRSEIRDPEAIKTARSENVIRARGGSNTIFTEFTERQIHCRRLMVQFVKQGSIKCRVCSHLVNVRQPGGVANQRAIWHASTHMEKPLYKCKICGKDIHVMSSVYRHMKKEHGITKGVTKEVEDRSSELHLEILDALTRSFDWTG